MCISFYVKICSYTYLYICLGKNIHIFIYVHICMYIYTYMNVCILKRILTFMHIYTCINIYTYLYICIYTYIYIYIYIYTSVLIFTFPCPAGHYNIWRREHLNRRDRIRALPPPIAAGGLRSLAPAPALGRDALRIRHAQEGKRLERRRDRRMSPYLPI